MSCNHLSDCPRCGAVVDDLEAEVVALEAEVKRLREVEATAKRIKAQAHLRGDHYGYDLMRTVLGKKEGEG